MRLKNSQDYILASSTLVFPVIMLLSTHKALASEEFCTRAKPSEPIQQTKKVPSCSINVDSMPKARLMNMSLDRGGNLLPPWINLTLARQGQKWAQKNYPKVSFGHLMGLIAVLAFPDGYTVLHFTNMSSTGPTASKRYENTGRTVASWYFSELKEDTTDNEALNGVLRVRGYHKAAMIAANKRVYEEKRDLINPELYKEKKIDEEMWAAFEKDLNASNVPQKFRQFSESYNKQNSGSIYAVNQFQLAMTQFAFVGYPVLTTERIGIYDATEEDLIAFNHLWAVFGWAMGIDDEFNICLQPDLQSVKDFYKHIFETYYFPPLFNCNFHCKLLLEACMKGSEISNLMMAPKVLLVRLLRDIFGIATSNLNKVLTNDDYIKLGKFYAMGMPV